MTPLRPAAPAGSTHLGALTDWVLLKEYKWRRSDQRSEEIDEPKLNLIRSLRPVLYVNIAVIIIIAILLFFLQAVPVSRAEPILAYHVGALYLAFAPALVLVASRFRTDREWLMIPIIMDVAEFLNSFGQVTLQIAQVNVPTDPNSLVPLIVTGVLTVYYVPCYRQLPRKVLPHSELAP